MSTDDRNLPLELRIPLGTVVDASTPPNLVSRNPGPSAISGASPGLATGAPTPLASPTLPDPSDPQAMTLLVAKLANEMFGGSSVVPSESPASIVGSPHGLHAPGSPGFSPSLVPGPAPAGADLSNPVHAGVPSGSAPTSSAPSDGPSVSNLGMGGVPTIPGPGVNPGPSTSGPTSGSPFATVPSFATFGGASPAANVADPMPASAFDQPSSSNTGMAGVPTSPTTSGSAPYGSAPMLASVGGVPGMGGAGMSSFGGVPGATQSSGPASSTSSYGSGSPFADAPSFASVGGMPAIGAPPRDDRGTSDSRGASPSRSSSDSRGSTDLRGTSDPRGSTESRSNPPTRGGSPHSGYGDAPTYGGAAPGYGGNVSHGSSSQGAPQREGIPSSGTPFADGQQVAPHDDGHSPTTLIPHGTPPPELTPAYSGGTPSAPPGVLQGAPKPSVPSARTVTEPVGDAPFGESVLDLGKLGLSPFGASPHDLTGTEAPISVGEATEPFGDSPFGNGPIDLSSIGLSPYGRAPTEGMTLPMVDTLPAGTGPYWVPPATALGIDMGEPRIASHDVRPGGDDRLIRDLGGNAFDPYRVRKDFPILEERVHGGKRLIWLDSAATTQKPRAVIDRVSYFYAHENSNVHRAAHALAARATDAYESARESVRRFINAPTTKEIVWVRGATEGINLVAQTWGKRHVGKGDEIVITHLEHHANIVPWQMLCAEKGARLRVAPVDDRGDVILEEYEKLMGPRTRLVAIPQVSNALGTITPTREMVEIAHRYGAKVLVDGAQSVSHMRVDVQQLDCEWFVFSGHKVFAPTGIGVVYAKREILEASPPYQGGGNMIEDVTFERTRYQPPPSRFEAGTGSIGDAVGLGAALDYVSKIGIETIDRYEHDLLVYGTRRLATVPGLTMIGTSKHKAGVMSFTLAGQRTEDISAELDKEGIAVRSGHHCAQPILRRFGVEATVRASLAFYNICEDIDALVEALHRLQGARR